VERDDEVPGKGRVVEAKVDPGEVGRLAAVAVEDGHNLAPGVLDAAVGGQQVGGVGDEAGVVVAAEVVTLGLKRRPVPLVVAPVAAGVEKHHISGPKWAASGIGLGDQQPVGLQAGLVDLDGLVKESPAGLGGHDGGVGGAGTGLGGHPGGHR